MIPFYGSYAVGSAINIPWNTNGSNGASITRAVNGTIKIYKDAGLTERASGSGVTDTEDHDGDVGTHMVSIDTSDNTDAGFYAAGHDYLVKITGQTIDGLTVSVWIAEFNLATVTIDTTLATMKTELDAIKAKSDLLPASPAATGAQMDMIDAPNSTALSAITASIFAKAFSAAYGALTFEQVCKVMLAVLAGKLSGAATTSITFRNLNDSADVVVATVDSNGNRTAVVITP